jgi:hypothetical protein
MQIRCSATGITSLAILILMHHTPEIDLPFSFSRLHPLQKQLTLQLLLLALDPPFLVWFSLLGWLCYLLPLIHRHVRRTMTNQFDPSDRDVFLTATIGCLLCLG